MFGIAETVKILRNNPLNQAIFGTVLFTCADLRDLIFFFFFFFLAGGAGVESLFRTYHHGAA